MGCNCMNVGNGNPGILNDAYGAFYAGGQRFFAWTNDAFNPTALGVSTRLLPASAPELVGTSANINIGGNSGNTLVSNFPTWSPLKSPVPWIIGGILAIFLYHWFEYGRGDK